jgi:serine/threonine protein kinase
MLKSCPLNSCSCKRHWKNKMVYQSEGDSLAGQGTHMSGQENIPSDLSLDGEATFAGDQEDSTNPRVKFNKQIQIVLKDSYDFLNSRVKSQQVRSVLDRLYSFLSSRIGAAPTLESMSLGDEVTLGHDVADQKIAIDDVEFEDLNSRYKVEGALGRGGMGEVLLAVDTRLDRKVAIKRILGEAASSKVAVDRFLNEAKSIAAINHPNIVQIYDYGRAKDGPFLIIEYVDGSSLLDRCRDGAISPEEAVNLTCQLCDGLSRAHDQGIVHRDIKPANVLLTKNGVPKITDFGLAKTDASDHQMTVAGAVLGTPDFMPPEQRRDAAEVDARSDLWSLAATLYQMVTGRSPKIIRFDLLPENLMSVLGKALEESKDDRFQTILEFRDALRDCDSDPKEQSDKQRLSHRDYEDLYGEKLLSLRSLTQANSIEFAESAIDAWMGSRTAVERRHDFFKSAEADLRAEIIQFRKRRESLRLEAEKHVSSAAYQDAINALSKIPEPHQSNADKGRIGELEERQDRLNQLMLLINSRLKKKDHDGLVVIVKEAVGLAPRRQKLVDLLRRLESRDNSRVAKLTHVNERASSALLQGDLGSACDVLESAKSMHDEATTNRASLLRKYWDAEQSLRSAIVEAQKLANVPAREVVAMASSLAACLENNPHSRELRRQHALFIDGLSSNESRYKEWIDHLKPFWESMEPAEFRQFSNPFQELIKQSFESRVVTSAKKTSASLVWFFGAAKSFLIRALILAVTLFVGTVLLRLGVSAVQEKQLPSPERIIQVVFETKEYCLAWLKGILGFLGF